MDRLESKCELCCATQGAKRPKTQTKKRKKMKLKPASKNLCAKSFPKTLILEFFKFCRAAAPPQTLVLKKRSEFGFTFITGTPGKFKVAEKCEDQKKRPQQSNLHHGMPSVGCSLNAGAKLSVSAGRRGVSWKSRVSTSHATADHSHRYNSF